MLSIGKAIQSLDNLEALAAMLGESYRGLLRDVRQYPVEVDGTLTAKYRASLDALLERLDESELSDTDFRLIASLFRGAQRDYKAQAEKSLHGLRDQLDETAGALGDLVATLASGAEDDDVKLRQELFRLKVLARSDDLAEIRAGIGAVAASLDHCIAEMKNKSQLRIAELSAEIKVLHKRIDIMVEPDAASCRRLGDIHTPVESAIAMGTAFSLVLVSLRNLSSIRGTHGETLLERLIEAALQRLATQVGPRGVVGAWSEGVLAGLMPDDQSNPIELSKLIVSRLGGTYSFSEGHQRQEILLQVSTGVVRHSGDEKPEQTERRILGTLRMIGAA